MRSPYILPEYLAIGDLSRLDQAWREPRTFAFIAEKSGVATEWVEAKLAALPEEYQANHFVLLTSGSTGKPKLVVGRRERAERLAGLLHKLQDSDPVRQTILALPLTYCYAFVNQWLWARQRKRELVLTPGLSQPDRLKAALTAARDAMICLIGAQVPLLVKYFGGSEFPGIIRVHFAGGRFPEDRLRYLRQLFPRAAVFNNYGCAEAMPRLTLRTAEAAPVARHIGWPLPGVEINLDEAGQMLFRSQYGAVAVVDEGGLLRVGEETWVPTGDLGVGFPDGHWEILGRTGEVFKRYGEKISLPQILTTVRAGWLGNAECYQETDRNGEAGYVLVLAPRPSDDEARRVVRALSIKHPRSHWPLRVESLPAMPLLANGKIDRENLGAQPEAVTHWKQHF